MIHERWSQLEPHEMLIPAIDTTSEQEAESLINIARSRGAWAVKIGWELESALGYKGCRELAADLGVKRVLDLKFYGISHTLSMPISKIMEDTEPPAGVTVAIQSGINSLRTVQNIVKDAGTVVFGVAHLTSIDPEETATYSGATPEQMIRSGALRGLKAGIGAIVCSGKELPILKASEQTAGMLTLVTGVRSEGIDKNDQSRVVTPAEAVHLGATAITMGRQILNAEYSELAYDLVLSEIKRGLSSGRIETND